MRGRVGVWPPLPPAAHLTRPRRDLPFPLPGAALFSRARHALWHGLRALGVGPGDAVLVPAYHHGSEVEVLVRLGVEPRFYAIGEDLAPDPESLTSVFDGSVRALHLVHYLGFPQDGDRWRQWCDLHGITLVEDAAQAFLADVDGVPVGSWGHLAVFCLYKTFGLPDGAVLTGDVSIDPPRSGTTGLGGTVRRHGAWVAQHVTVGTVERSGAYDAARDFALGDVETGPTAVTRRLTTRVSDPAAAATRRANYARLHERLAHRVPAEFAMLPAGASPMVFPVAVDDKRAFLSSLARHGVVGLDLWSAFHPATPAEGFERERRLRRTVVGLPVHQELSGELVDHIADATRAA